MNARIFLALLLVVAGCASSTSNRSAIESVLDQRARVKGKSEELGPMSTQLVVGLKAIDVRNCPGDFRSAWFDYLVEVEDLNTRITRVARLVSPNATPPSDLLSVLKAIEKNPALGQYLIAALDRVDDAWRKLERTAMKCDVMPERDAAPGQKQAQ